MKYYLFKNIILINKLFVPHWEKKIIIINFILYNLSKYYY